MQFYKGYFGTIVSVFRRRDNWEAYLEEHLNGYSASQAVAASLLSKQKSNTKVLVFPEMIGPAFYLRKAKIISVGDYFGPARYADLARDILSGNCLPYLARFDISAIILQPRWWWSFYDEFRPQLKGNGFREYRCPGDNVAIFLRNDINPSSQLIPVTQ
jgi:hypothetical protein